tara:strand:+ start:1378 stop:2091 length:714 start_codon:yes stop_codon:yes gene_type:complete
VIPSYQRAEQLKEKTLTYLELQGVDKKDIYIFVRTDDSKLSEYESIEGINLVTTDIKGIGKTHNYITEYFDEGQFIIEIDDDLVNLIDNNKQSVNLQETIQKMKDIMTEENISYGGIYQCDNSMFMSSCKEYTTDLRYMLGLFRLRFIRKDIILETNYAEDFENAILHYLRDGKILKNNWLCGRTKNYAEGGCCGDGRNLDTEKADKEHLATKYTELTRLFIRKSGITDLRLKDRRK